MVRWRTLVARRLGVGFGLRRRAVAVRSAGREAGLVALIGALALSSAAAAIQLGAGNLETALATLVGETCQLVGHLTLLLALSLYARHVILDVQGLLPVRKASPVKVKCKAERAAKPESSSGTTKVDPPHPAGTAGRSACGHSHAPRDANVPPCPGRRFVAAGVAASLRGQPSPSRRSLMTTTTPTAGCREPSANGSAS